MLNFVLGVNLCHLPLEPGLLVLLLINKTILFVVLKKDNGSIDLNYLFTLYGVLILISVHTNISFLLIIFVWPKINVKF
jgi:hypothetical protein